MPMPTSSVGGWAPPINQIDRLGGKGGAKEEEGLCCQKKSIQGGFGKFADHAFVLGHLYGVCVRGIVTSAT